MVHKPVLVEEVIDLLNINPDGRYLDATTGEGGHAGIILERLSSQGRLICLDRDKEILNVAAGNLALFGEKATFIQANFADFDTALSKVSWDTLDGVLMDIGLSSFHTDSQERGFSFRKPGPLDMRFDRTQGESLANLLERLSEEELADIIWQYGEERHSRRIAASIRKAWDKKMITNTVDLSSVIAKATGYHPGTKRHPATRTFQALRIAVNQELNAVTRALQKLPSYLREGGRIIVISYHSLEDRIVKKSFAENNILKVLTSKPVTPKSEEMKTNARARSAKLRAAEKITL